VSHHRARGKKRAKKQTTKTCKGGNGWFCL